MGGIRPEVGIEGISGEMPFAEVLIVLLSANASGRLEVSLSPSRGRNRVVFRSGVPVQVFLPDLEPSLISLLIQDGNLSRERGQSLVEDASEQRLTESELLEAKQVLSLGVLRDARLRRARAQLIRLIDMPGVHLRFVEGVERLDPAEITLLEPLSLIYRGFRASPAGRAARAYLPEHPSVLRLASSYPSGVDPFGFGLELEAALQSEFSLEGLLTRGWSREEVQAALASLTLTDMLEVERSPRRRGLTPTSASNGGGLVVQRRFGPPKSLRRPDSASSGNGTKDGERRVFAGAVQANGGSLSPESDRDPEAGPSGPAELIARRLKSFEGQTYFQILRVGPETEDAQLERAYRFLLRRILDEFPDAGTSALGGLLREAYIFLKDPVRKAKYAGAGVSEREAMEADAKLDRSLRLLGESKDDEALYTIEWAARLVPTRPELSATQEGVWWLCQDEYARGNSPVPTLASHAARTGDGRIKLVLAAVHAQQNDLLAARELLMDVGRGDHPLIARFVSRGPT